MLISLSLIVGILLGLHFRVIIFVPVMGVGALLTAATLFSAALPIPITVLWSAGSAIALQFGYLIGLTIRFAGPHDYTGVGGKAVRAVR